MALDFLNESASDTAEANAMRAETTAPNPEPAAPPKAPDPVPPPAAEPPKAAEPAPAEPKAAEPPAVKKDGAPVGFVPNAALREAREAIQARDRRIAELEGRPNGQQQPPPDPTKEIDPETDPIAALKEVREFQKTQREREQQQHQLREFSNRVQAHEADWAAANPDYADQVAYLREFRAGQLEGEGRTKEEIGAILFQEALMVSDRAFKLGKNPGEVFSTLAVKSGWKAKDAAAPATPAAPAAPAGPDPAIEQKRVESEAALERISRGQKASRATAGGGGNEPAEDMTVERLASLNGAAFDAAMEKHGKRLFGGG